MNNTVILVVAKEFSPTPGFRTKEEGPFPAVDFRDKLLYPRLKDAIENNDSLIVDLDGAAGYGTSFLEEAFGGLIRECKLSYEDIMAHLQLKSEDDPSYIEEINGYLSDANNN